MIKQLSYVAKNKKIKNKKIFNFSRKRIKKIFAKRAEQQKKNMQTFNAKIKKKI